MEHAAELKVKTGTWDYGNNTFKFVKPSGKSVQIPLENVLWAEYLDNHVAVSALIPKANKLILKRVVEALDDKEEPKNAESWVHGLMQSAYPDVEPKRRLRILLNPVGGPGQAQRIFEEEIKPIFEAANCEYDLTVTERKGHIFDLVKVIDLQKFDAIVVLSGDGGVHEAFNGLAYHPQGQQALRIIPVVQVPTGSANALCVNTLGPKDGFSIGKACLNVIKGKLMKLDICSIIQGEKRSFSFLSQAIGLMADIDLGTEKLRWMGDGRFILGYLRGVMGLKHCPIELEMKVAHQDKTEMADKSKNALSDTFYDVPTEEHPQQGLPPLYHIENDDGEEDWIKWDKPILYLYGGSMPYVARDLMQFPVATLADGYLDLVIQEPASRTLLIKSIAGASKGRTFWEQTQNYFKVHAYRVKPKGSGYISFDGEFFPFEPFAVEVHPSIGRTLSLQGRFIGDAFHQ